MTLHKQRVSKGLPATKSELEMEQTIRQWPRTPETDPYKTGLESLASHLEPLLGGSILITAYNEFCAPNLTEAIEALITEGVKYITVASTMFTPGGSHSEQEIPDEIKPLTKKYPDITIVYAWPYDLNKVAHLLKEQICTFDLHACER
jgi:sirohydrochlorin cobaltochelatase